MLTLLVLDLFVLQTECFLHPLCEVAIGF